MWNIQPPLRWLARAALVCGLLGAHAANAQQAEPTSKDAQRTLSPYFVVSDAEPGVDALPLKSTAADVAIAGNIADVRVTQTYRNEGAVPIEARYVFPASTRAAVYALRMRIGERVVDAQVREKQQARQQYEQAKREGKSASLLEQHRPNVFQMNVANVMAGDEIAVELRYTETIVPTEGLYRFVFPTVVGPRYNGGISENGQPTESHKNEKWIAQPTLRAGQDAKHSFALNATINAPFPVQAVSSPSHKLRIDGIGTQTTKLELPAANAHANRDVVIDYRLAAAQVQTGVLLQQGKDENFFLLMAEPPARVNVNDIVPREYVFIVDVSGSMHGFPLDVTKTLMRELIARLRPSDTFNVIPFAGGHSLLHPASVPATEENVARAIRFINAQGGGGGTELLPALRTALAMPSDLGRARSFVVVTDGYVSVEKEAFDLIRNNLGRANLFSFGIGSSVNRHLIEGMARAGKGEPFFVLNQQQAEEEAPKLRRLIEAPVLTRIRVNFDGFDAYDLDTPQLPDLFAQRPIVLSGKFRGKPEGKIEIEGINANGAVRMSIDVAVAAQTQNTQALRYLWARSRIAALSDQQQLDRGDQIAKTITQLGLQYNLLTEYTSFIAIDRIVRNASGDSMSVDQPQALPQGVSELAVGQAPSTPEPEFAALAALAGGLMWWARRRKKQAQSRDDAVRLPEA